MSDFTRDNGGLTDRFIVIRQSDGQVVFDTEDLEEARQALRDLEEEDQQNAYCLADMRSPAFGDKNVT